MKKKITTIILIIVGILVLFFIRSNYSDHNLKRTVEACMLATKQTSNDFNKEEARKYCEKQIKKNIKNE
tara:strand:+ start:375 stop:581 length:207 start_codon:yes stop_codon:yes gene_type:complete